MIVFLRGEPWVPACGDGNLVAPGVQFSTQQLRLAVCASDKWWIVIAC